MAPHHTLPQYGCIDWRWAPLGDLKRKKRRFSLRMGRKSTAACAMPKSQPAEKNGKKWLSSESQMYPPVCLFFIKASKMPSTTHHINGVCLSLKGRSSLGAEQLKNEADANQGSGGILQKTQKRVWCQPRCQWQPLLSVCCAFCFRWHLSNTKWRSGFDDNELATPPVLPQ